jgi:hypothetical protein
MHPTTALPRLPGYDLAAPSEADALAALQRVFGPSRGVDAWTAACRDAGLAVGTLSSIEELELASQSLARQPGAAATVARAIALRLRTYSRLAARATASRIT